VKCYCTDVLRKAYYIENDGLKIRNLVMLRLLLITIFLLCAGVAVYVAATLNDSFVYSALFCAAVGGALLAWLVIWSYQKGREENLPRPYASAKLIEQTETTTPKLPASALLEATMYSMREGVLVIGSDTRVIAMNDAARALFTNAQDGAKAEGKRLSELTRHPLIVNAFRSTLENNKPTQVKVETLSTEKRFFDLRVEPLKSNESNGGAIGVFFDITRLERLEKVRQEFLSNVSHELRTPLAAILAYVETLEDGAIDDAENNYRFLNVIRKNSERMQTLVEDILELSSIEAGNIRIESQEVHLKPIIEDVIESLAGRTEQNRVKIINEVAENVLVYADPKRLEQMLTNLIDNAIKFNRENGSVTITHESNETRDVINITDTGAGILPEHIPRIFERFYRVDRARSRDLGGTGLGLAIVKHLARAHGGEATVQSSYGVGSTFTIEFPKV
jgi:two-component system phosphate regulon sensor histidine kinase PhoR